MGKAKAGRACGAYKQDMFHVHMALCVHNKVDKEDCNKNGTSEQWIRRFLIDFLV